MDVIEIVSHHRVGALERKIEECKIECARKFFTKITSDQIRYEVVTDYGKLMERVK